MRDEQWSLRDSSCFSFRCRVDWRTEKSITGGNYVPIGLTKPLVLVIIHPSICHKTDIVKSPGMPLTPANQRRLVSAQLALRYVHTRTNLIWPVGGSCDWSLIIPPSIFSHGNLAWLYYCVGVCECGHSCERNYLAVTVKTKENRLCASIFRKKEFGVCTWKHPHWRSHMRSHSSSSCSLVFCWWNISLACDKAASPLYPGFVKESSKCQRVPLTPTGFVNAEKYHPRLGTQARNFLHCVFFYYFLFFFSFFFS